MATFEAQIEALTGIDITTTSTPTRDELLVFLNNGVKEVINRIVVIAPEKATLFSKTGTLQNDLGIDVPSGIVIDVVRENGTMDQYQPAAVISSNLRYRATDTESLYYRSKYNPVWYILNSTVYVLPAPGGSGNSAEITYLAHKEILLDGSSLDWSTTDGVIDFPSQYEYILMIYASHKTLMAALQSLTSDLPSDLVSPTLETVESELPEFSSSAPFELPDPPEDANINFTELVNLEEFVTPNLSVSVPEYSAPDVNPNFGDADQWINVEEDPEMSSARVQVIQAELAQYGVDTQNAQHKFQKELNDMQLKLEIYKSELQKEDTRIKLNLTEYETNVRKALEKYQAETGYDLEKYKSLVQANIENYKQGLTQNMTAFETNLNKFQSDYQAVASKNQILLGKFSAELQNFTAKVGKIKMDYDWMQGRAIALKGEYEAFFITMINPKAMAQQQEQRQQPRR